MERLRCGVAILGGGSSRRMDGLDKTFMDLLERPVLAWTVSAFERSEFIDRIVVVLPIEGIKRGEELAKSENWKKVSKICKGGRRRQDSSRAGLEFLSDCDIVMIHDAARPCITEGIVQKGFDAVKPTGAAVAATRVTDTIHVAGERFEIIQTLDRNCLWRAQTPQIFSYEIMIKAHSVIKEDVTDDATMAKMIGAEVRLYECPSSNIKITTRSDIPAAESFLRSMFSAAF